MSKEMKLIPELRFPEFINEREWIDCSIDSIGEVVTGGTPSKREKKFWGGDFAWVTAQDFKGKYISDSFLKLTQKGKEKSRVIPPNSVLVTCIASIGLNGINKVECATNQQINSIICNSDNNFEFVYYAISKNCNRLKNLAGQTAVPIVNKSVFENFTIHKPDTPKEQQKIASCLSSIDELVAAHSDKLKALKDHKKGLMQNLFPQKGQKVPNYRFPEFEKDGEWNPKPIAEVFSIFQGYAFSSKDSVPKGTIWLKIADVGIQEMKHDSPSFLPLAYKEEYKRFLLKKGDYVIALTRPILSMQLKIAQVDDAYDNSLLNQRVGKLETTNDSSFVYYLLQTTNMVESINRNIAGNEPPNLSFQQISDILVFIPKEKTEQHKIASCFSALDKLISAQVEKIEQLQQHKKGLMQGLFPKIES